MKKKLENTHVYAYTRIHNLALHKKCTASQIEKQVGRMIHVSDYLHTHTDTYTHTHIGLTH